MLGIAISNRLQMLARPLPCLWLLIAGIAIRCHADEPSFGRQIRPILAERCFSCHGPDESEGGLQLHDREMALGETDSGARAIVPGDWQKSALIERVATDDEDLRMPPTGEGEPLTNEEIKLLQTWIAQGAEWNEHWAFEPVASPDVPQTHTRKWIRNPIDSFILHRLAFEGLEPSPEAARSTLIRRAYYDLLGLPPTPEEVARFVADTDPKAYEGLIDRLLESPHYGEKWGRHWLDLVRYAESNSFERDNPKPHVWRYRDYVIQSFNDDKPFDQFIEEQLAGDELPNPTADSMVATGYYRLGLWDDEPSDRLQAKYDVLDDIVKTHEPALPRYHARLCSLPRSQDRPVLTK